MRRTVKHKIIIYCIFMVVGFLLFRYIAYKDVDWDSMMPEEDLERVHRKVAKHDKWIVVTSIQYPTPQLRALLKIPGWKLIVVGDRKSPTDWKLPGAIYLNLATQKALKYRIYKFLPFDSYTRKCIGYLYAIEHGASYIYETDDDNEPFEDLKTFHIGRGSSVTAVVADTKKNITYNPYPHFGQSSLWPRGYPLEYVGNDQPRIYRTCTTSIPAIQQGLVDGDPDVDAIFRLTRKHSSVNLDLVFDHAAPPVVLPKGVFAPYNSQNTLITARAFWSLILPTSVKVRACDIYRSYWAQRLMWLTGSHLAFYPPTSLQKRNPHSHIKDATEEAELYQNMGRYVKFLSEWTCKETFFFDCARKLTEELVILGFLEKRDLELVDAWITDLATVGYLPPAIRQHPELCSSNPENSFLFHPWEKNTSILYSPKKLELPLLHAAKEFRVKMVEKNCGSNAAFHAMNSPPSVVEDADKILLVISFKQSVDIIPMLDSVYRPYFPHILYCGKKENLHELMPRKISYISPVANVNAASCLNRALKLGYNVQGYLHISSHSFLLPQSLHVSSRNKNQVWTLGDPQVYKANILRQCNENGFQCIELTVKKLSHFQNRLDQLDIEKELKSQIKKCFIKISQDEMLKHDTGVKYLLDPAFHIPAKLNQTYKTLLTILDIDEKDEQYSFLVFLLLSCLELVPEYLHSADLEQRLESESSHFDLIVPFDFKLLQKSEVKMYCDFMDKI